MKTLLRFFFKLLYHQFAFTYDLVSGTVSLGRWKDWVMSILPFIEGRRVLEIGFGPGHLQRTLLSQGLVAVGIDESAQMARLAKHNLTKTPTDSNTQHTSHLKHQRAYTQANITRGLAQHLPFPDHCFDTIVATFPAEYITNQRTLEDVKRCLADGGRFIVLPVAIQIGRGLLDRAMALLFRATHQSPSDPIELVRERLREPFARADFEVEIKELQVKSSLLLVIIAKPSRSRNSTGTM